jgi:tetratricopeptide (TPR) repeat protein
MFELSKLLRGIPQFQDSRMSGAGFAVWIVWKGKLPDAVPHTFQDYGGINFIEEDQQALWFFFTSDVVRALARLEVWARINSMPVFIQLFPAQIRIGYQLERSMTISRDLLTQQTDTPEDFEIYIHPKFHDIVAGIPGLALESPSGLGGMAPLDWKVISADPRIGYQSQLGWYFILKPLGNPMDKNFNEGWRNFFQEIEAILKRLKLKYIFHRNFLIFRLDNHRTLTTWCRDLIKLVQELKECGECKYWPSVMAAVEKEGLNFNEELPYKIAIDWDQMVPDYPHMTYRTGFLLGDRFKIQDVGFSLERTKMSDWCYVSLKEGDIEEATGSLQVFTPPVVVAGKQKSCFYCGLRNHEPSQCPTRNIEALHPEIWGKLAGKSMDDISSEYEALGDAMGKEPLESLNKAVRDESAVVPNAFMEINHACQLRMIQPVWRSLGKELPQGLTKLAPEEKNNTGKALKTFMGGDIAAAEQAAKQEELRSPRDLQARVLLGFINMEKGEHEKAIKFWQDAEALALTPLQHAWILFLIGRLYEVDGHNDNAINMYKNAAAYCPKWMEPKYRQAAAMVKMGFAEHAFHLLDELIARDADIFNRVIIDPELERGSLQIMAHLWGPWNTAQTQADESKERLNQLYGDCTAWFGEESEFSKDAHRRIDAMMGKKNIANYVIYQKFIKGEAQISSALKAQVEDETKILQKKAVEFSDRLSKVDEEIAWFPFPKTLREFNSDYNSCVSKLNWVKSQHFMVAENFRKSTEFFQEVDEMTGRLSSRLVSLKIVRDATLFILLLGKSFIWLELIGLGVALLVVPALLYLAQESGAAWTQSLLIDRRWEIQKALIIILSVAALTVSLLRTATGFEKKKTKFFENKGVFTAKEAEAKGV